MCLCSCEAFKAEAITKSARVQFMLRAMGKLGCGVDPWWAHSNYDNDAYLACVHLRVCTCSFLLYSGNSSTACRAWTKSPGQRTRKKVVWLVVVVVVVVVVRGGVIRGLCTHLLLTHG